MKHVRPPVVYAKPPVVEVALTFNFEPSDETPGWSEGIGSEFVKVVQSFSNYPKQGKVINQNIQVISDIKNGVSYANMPRHMVKEVNVKNNEETEILGVGKNYLTFHKIRSGIDHPRYLPVAEKFFEYLPHYRNFWKPKRIQNIVLSYVNIIEIPEVEFDIDKYFILGVQFPDEMGKISQFETHLIFQPEMECGIGLDLRFSKVPITIPNQNKTLFYLFGNYYKTVCDETQLNVEAEKIHQYARQFFDKCLTDECTKLFE
ncbi:hypothetical protein FACS189427_10800 [Planctomycetales bacterium]|nr:hypothetical protein FACS189427_10800 [Planctomycetales bacterium]